MWLLSHCLLICLWQEVTFALNLFFFASVCALFAFHCQILARPKVFSTWLFKLFFVSFHSFCYPALAWVFFYRHATGRGNRKKKNGTGFWQTHPLWLKAHFLFLRLRCWIHAVILPFTPASLSHSLSLALLSFAYFFNYFAFYLYFFFCGSSFFCQFLVGLFHCLSAIECFHSEPHKKGLNEQTILDPASLSFFLSLSLSALFRSVRIFKYGHKLGTIEHPPLIIIYIFLALNADHTETGTDATTTKGWLWYRNRSDSPDSVSLSLSLSLQIHTTTVAISVCECVSVCVYLLHILCSFTAAI